MGNNYSPDISFSIKRHDTGERMILKLRKSKIVWLQLFIAFILTIEPKLFTQYTITVLIYAVGNLAMFVIYFYKVCKGGKISKYLFAWVCLEIYSLLIMIINGNVSDIDQWGYLTLMVCNYILIIEWCVQNNYLKEMLTALSAVCLIFIFINAMSLLLFPNGIIPSKAIYDNGDGDYYFLGIKTAYTSYIFVALAASGICLMKYRMKKLCILTVAVSVFNILYANISTGIVCLVALLILILIKKVFKMQITMKFVLAMTIILNVAVVIFGAQYMFSGVIENILHKSMTLTGRTDIWSNALVQIKNQNLIATIFGNGIVNGGSFVEFGNGLWPAHNQWIQNVFEYGIVGTLGLIVFMRNSINKKSVILRTENYLLNIIFVMLIGTITMQYLGYAHVYLLFVLLKHADEIEETI